MSEIRILNLCHNKSILVDIYRQSLLSGTMFTNCSALEFPCRLHFFFFQSKIIPEKNYVLRESAKSP